MTPIDSVTAALSGSGLPASLAAFVLAGLAVFAVATRLARYVDAIAAATGLGRLFAGTVLLAASTSLPELTTDVNAAALGHVDIGVGDLFGSTLANMLLLACIDLALRRREILRHVAREHVHVALLGILVTAMAGAALGSGGGWLRVGHVGIETLAIVVLYFVGMRAVFAAGVPDRRVPEPSTATSSTSAAAGPPPLRTAMVGFGLTALALLFTAPLLVVTAEAVAISSGAGSTFVGTLLVGFTTSFPEIAASVAAVRMGAPDLAVGNVFGSNAFNMCLLAAMDLAYLPGPILAYADPAHATTAHLCVVALGLGALGIVARGRLRIAGLPAPSLLIVATYGAAAVLLARGP